MAWTAMFFLWKKYRICDTLKNGIWRWNYREASRCGMNKHKGYKHKRYENKYTA